jgi:hypothetical protein
VRAVALKTSKEICNLLSTFRTLDPTTVPADRRKIDKVRLYSATTDFLLLFLHLIILCLM